MHEAVQVAVQHALRVTDLVAGARVLHHLVGVQHVVADLAAKVHVEHLAHDLAVAHPRFLLLGHFE